MADLDRTYDRRFIVSRQYGRTMEAIQHAEQAFHAALRARDYAEAARCLKDRDEWLDLARDTPRFVHELPGASHG